MSSTLGNKINARRRELKFSIDKLAELSGTSKSYIWELENRESSNPSAEKIENIAKALGVTVIGLTGRDGGRIKEFSDVSIIVPVQETFKIQELHLPVYHALCLMLEDHFYES